MTDFLTELGTEIQNAITTTEADVVKWIGEINTGLQVAEQYLQDGLNWIAKNTPAIASAVQLAESLVAQVVAATPGAAQNATVTQAIADANIAVNELNQFAVTANAGNTAVSLAAGYIAIQNGIAAASKAKAAAATLTATPAA